MKTLFLSLLGFALVVASATAQNANANNNAASGKSSDEAWTTLVGLTTPPPPSPLPRGQTKRTPAQASADAEQKAQQARQAAKAAKDFYTAFPTHINVAEAKKLEALQALHGVTDGDAPFEASARQIANAYRNNKANPAADRFEVAVLAERVDGRGKLGGKVFGNSPTELEKIADKLQTEFGELPEAYYFYASVARTADMDTAGRMADKLLRAQGAPAEAKAEAQDIKERQSLIGSSLNVKLSPTSGPDVDLASQAGKLTIIYVWSTAGSPSGMAGLLPVKKSLPPDAQVIYLALGNSGEQLKELEEKKPVPGLICVERQPFSANSISGRLKVRHTPYVYILNRAGKLQAFGPAPTLPALLATVTR